MARECWPILIFATAGILISTFFVGGAMWFVLGALDIGILFLHCLLFGALISPTDPIAVLAILKTTAVPRALQEISPENPYSMTASPSSSSSKPAAPYLKTPDS